jgi:Predicted transcriptional regulators
MTIRDKIFAKLEEYNMTQKEFSEKTGIPQTTISDWKKKKTNPTAEKILVICKVLNVTPEWLLSGVETHGSRSNPDKLIVVDSDTDAGELISAFNSFDPTRQERLLGYMMALRNIGAWHREESVNKEQQIKDD